MSDGDFRWNRYGADYPAVNKNLNGLPDWLRKVGSGLKSAGKWAWQDMKPWAIPSYSATASAVNAALGGFPRAALRAVANKIPSWRGRATLGEEFEQQHPIAGGVAKGIGLAIPTIATMGTSLAASGAGAVAPTLASSLGRNALITAATAVPTAGAEAMETGNIPKALKHLAINQALGTGLGAAGEFLPAALATGAQNAKLRQAGLRPQDFLKAMRGGARAAGVGAKGVARYSRNAAQSARQRILGVINRFGGGRKAAEGVSDFLSEGYGKLGQLYDQSGTKVGKDLLGAIDADQRIAQLRAVTGNPGAVDDAILNLSQRADMTGFRDVYGGVLTDVAEKGATSDITSAARVNSEVARVIKDHMAKAAEKLRVAAGRTDIPSIRELASMVGANKALAPGMARQATALGMGATPGSDTASRLGVLGLVGRGAQKTGAGVAGALTGAAMAPRPKRDAPIGDWLKYLGLVGVAGVGGQMLGRGAARAWNAAAPAVLGAAGPVSEMALRGGQTLAGLGAAIPAEEKLPVAVPQAAATEAKTEQIAATEEQVAPVAKEEAKQAVNEAFAGRVNERLQVIYDQIIQTPGYTASMTFKEFSAAVREVTEDYDPKRVAPILFTDPEERQRYLDTYEQALILKSMDVEGAFGGTSFADPARSRTLMAKRQLQNYMGGLLGGPEKMAQQNVQDQVEADLAAIRRLPLPPAEKQKALRQMLRVNYGLDLEMLSGLGLEV